MRIKNGLVVGVILLFIGVGIQPAMAVNPDTSDSEDDCNLCPKVSSLHLVRLKSLLNRIEKYDNILSVLSKKYPEVAEKYQELLERITTFKEMNQESLQWKFPFIRLIFCPFSIVILSVLFVIGGFMTLLPGIDKFYEKIFIPLLNASIYAFLFFCCPFRR